MTFSPEIYELIRQGCISSAQIVVPVVAERFKPVSVVDVGGGEGWWSREFLKHGVKHAAVMDESVEAPVEHESISFLPLNLEAESISKFGYFGYDIAVCLEVAEHVGADHADSLVAQLCDVAPVVLFSAAIPGQGGHGHLNEQWPVYWGEKFWGHGYAVSEDLRWQFWTDDAVEPWYRQNLLVAGKPKTLIDAGFTPTSTPLSVVHPIFWRDRVLAP